jgi:hypothetical protein
MKRKVVTGLAVQSEKYGIGHAARLNSLLNATKESGWSPNQFDLIRLTADQTQLPKLIAEIEGSDCLILDVDPRFVEENLDLLDHLLGTVNQTNCALVLFDSGTGHRARQSSSCPKTSHVCLHTSIMRLKSLTNPALTKSSRRPTIH